MLDLLVKEDAGVRTFNGEGSHSLGHGKAELSSSSGTPGGSKGTLVILVGPCGWEGSSQQSRWLDRVRGTCSPARGLI